MVAVEAFLTAYDPSDLPASSIDPLGFDRGYMWLAEKLLPGLTNVAAEPRYFGLLSAGALLGTEIGGESRQAQYRRRLEVVLRLERFWVLANVLAESEELPVYGVRGVLRTREFRERLEERGAKATDVNFQMLSRQVPYGGIGIYGAVADGMRIWDRKELALSPGLGVPLGEAFIEETGMPPKLRKVARDGGEVSLKLLREWGEAAHNALPVTAGEARCLWDAANRDEVRARMLALLWEHPGDPADELGWLAGLEEATEGDEGAVDLREAMTAIRFFEAAYQWALLGFERVLWQCRSISGGMVKRQALAADAVLQEAFDRLPPAAVRFEQAVQKGTTAHFREGAERVRDIREFFAKAAGTADPLAFVDVLLARHEQVQRGKFDNGRPKMPWVAPRDGGVALSMTQVGGLSDEPVEPAQIRPHQYRLGSATRLNYAARRA